MTLFQQPNDTTLSLSEKIEGAYNLVTEREIINISVEAPSILKLDVRNSFADAFYLDCRIGDFTLLEHHLLEGVEGEELGEVDFTSGLHELSICVTTPQGISYVDAKVFVPPEFATLTIDLWDAHYPPNVFINDDWVNRPPGVEYAARSTPPEMPEADRLNLYIVHTEYGSSDSAAVKKFHHHQELGPLAQLLGVDLDVWIDGKRPCETNTEPDHVFGPVYHMEALSPGLHRLRIGDRLRNQLLLDSDVLVNGVDDLVVTIDDPPGELFSVAITQGASPLYSATAENLAFIQGLSPAGPVFFDLKVGGHTLPDGLSNWLDEIKRSRKTQERIRANYQLFLKLRKSAKAKKAAGTALNDDEKAVDKVTDSNELTKWLIAKKAKEGLKLGVAGTTGADGTVTVTDRKIKTPFDRFSDLETRDVHEASHVVQFANHARAVGLDYDKYKELSRLRQRYKELDDKKKKGEPVDETELNDVADKLLELMIWSLTPPAKGQIERFNERTGDPERAAQDEIDEYAAGIKFMSDVIRLLEAQKFHLIFGPSLLRVRQGAEETVVLRQKPDTAPRIRVVEGGDKVEISGPEGTPGAGGTLYTLKIKGLKPGRARLEVICGTLRSFITVTVR